MPMLARKVMTPTRTLRLGDLDAHAQETHFIIPPTETTTKDSDYLRLAQETPSTAT